MKRIQWMICLRLVSAILVAALCFACGGGGDNKKASDDGGWSDADDEGAEYSDPGIPAGSEPDYFNGVWTGTMALESTVDHNESSATLELTINMYPDWSFDGTFAEIGAVDNSLVPNGGYLDGIMDIEWQYTILLLYSDQEPKDLDYYLLWGDITGKRMWGGLDAYDLSGDTIARGSWDFSRD
ncbi:MAG TPA: hypothetical protein PKW95_22865 [bacterium]|nr:hypothetical protein [bacterium]